MPDEATAQAPPTESLRVLIADDEPLMLENCRRALEADGYACALALDAEQAVSMLEADAPDILLSDLRMPGGDGMWLLERSRSLDPMRPVIIFTGFATIESAVSAVKAGAFDYLAKPFSADQLRLAVRRAAEQRRLLLENLHLREQLHGAYGLEQIVGKSAALKAALEIVRKVARSSANVLILGESGTGKELVARAIHTNSGRVAHAFVAIDCAVLPENLLESELFGYERGAFTGAVSAKPGLFELAHRGTLFLDEVGDLPLSLQAKLLRVLQERRTRRLGGVRETELELRVVAATNCDLRRQIGAGRFREDLFYRLQVVDIVLPPLRERPGDVKLLAQTFLARYGKSGEQWVRGFEPQAMAALEAYTWPGNVRELQNVIERACALACGETIGLDDLPAYLRAAPSSRDELSAPPFWPTLKEARRRWLEDLDAAYLRAVLEKEHGNVSQAARTAGVDRKTIRRLLNRQKAEHPGGAEPEDAD